MKHLSHLLLFCSIILLTGCTENGTEYYLDPIGDDSAPGTSPGRAWKSIEKINATDLNPGDRVLFKAGKTFTGSLKFDLDDSGTPDNPVTIGSYGEGRAVISSGSDYGLYAENTSGFVVQDLVFMGAGAEVDGKFSGIYFYTDLDSIKPEFIRIDNVEVSGYRWEGIAIFGEREGSSGFRDIRITHAEVHDNGDKGIAAGGPMPEGDWAHKDLYVGHCRVYNNRGIPGKKGHSGNGIVLSSVDGGMIEYCSAYNNGEFSDDPETGGPIGIWFWDTRNGVIQFCESYDNKTGNNADGGGFDLDGGCVNCIMQYNYSHGNHGAGYGIYQYNGAREFRGNVIRYNISENDGINNKYGGIDLWSTNSSGGMQDTKIYNNTIFVSELTNGAAIEEFPDEEGASYLHNTEIYNNVFVGVPGKKLVDIPYPSDRWTFKGNCYWTYGDEIQIRWGDKTFESLDAWRAATGQERHEGGNAGIEADPLLAGPGEGGTIGDPNQLNRLDAYRLKQSSVLVDLGLDLKSLFGIEAGTHDFYGTQIMQGSKFDIGANEVEKASGSQQ
jgi:hypothetical protein